MDINIRQQKLLATIVKEYSETAEPVGSQELGEKYNLNISPATIRNEMVVLENKGYISQPHKSAGRVPTDKGYRFFVNELMQRFELSEKERHRLKTELVKLQASHEQLGRSISRLVSEVSGQAAFTLLPHDASATGLSQIITEPDLSDPHTMKGVAELFDHIDQHAGKLMKQAQGQEAFIGTEVPLPMPKNMSLIVSNIKMKNGKRGLIGIVGPKRMSYAKNLSILEYLAKLISGTAVIIMVVTNV
jgi:transcriptional regulator of heat shock response